MAGERSPKQFDFHRRETRLSAQARQLHTDALRVESELVLLLRREWFLIQDYNIQMLEYLELQLTCEIMRRKLIAIRKQRKRLSRMF
ncbi:hypothetical protein ACH3XW_26500 [Acanthocheilonema viteae]|uniref:Uncharacterized protein n=1 Tax=Acanthocheilonema viteae TaxID=6277 RepID=A0A498STI8_ACAVI|nr:unnamed protein product [Acanthocheilonema viteae]